MIKKVHRKKGMGIFMLSCSIFILGVSVMIGPTLNTITGTGLFIMSIFYLNNSVIDYTKDEIRMKNLYGMTLKKYSLNEDKVELKDGNVYINDKRIRMAKYLLNTKDVGAFMNFVSTGEITDEPNS